MRDPVDDQVFIIRCWNERRGNPDKPALWRVRVTHLNSDQEVHFNSPLAIIDFITNCLAAAESIGCHDTPG